MVKMMNITSNSQAEKMPVDEQEMPTTKFGILVGKLTVPDDFDEPLHDEILAEFESW